MADVTKFLSLAGLQNYDSKIKAYIGTAVQGQLTFELVDALPEVGVANVIYLVPNKGETQNVKDEFMWINSAWELIGTTTVDLSDYYTKGDADGKFETIVNADLVRGRVSELETEAARLESVKADKLDLNNYYDKDAIDGKVTEINNAATDLSGRVSTAEATITEHGTAIADRYTKGEVDNKISEVNGAAEALEGRVSAAEGTITEHGTAIADRYTKGEVDNKISEVNGAAEALEGRVEANEGAIEALQSGKADKATTLSGYGIADAYTKTEVDNLVEGINGAAESLEGRVEALEGTVGGMYTNQQIDDKIEEVATVVAESVNDLKVAIGADDELKVSFAGTEKFAGCSSIMDALNVLDGEYTDSEIDAAIKVVDDKFAGKADKSVVDAMYTNAQIDTKLDGKMDDGDAYLKSETYTQEEVNGLVAQAEANAIAAFTEISTAEIEALFV